MILIVVTFTAVVRKRKDAKKRQRNLAYIEPLECQAKVTTTPATTQHLSKPRS